ncbi:MAG: hypothetical protein KDJ77_05550 [Rhodobiaceae bacterium]|nr:hypothetical protein [Rhodobiaceae bacterium]
MKRLFPAFSGLAVALAMSAAAHAADTYTPSNAYDPGTVAGRMPAVSGINGKLVGLGGVIDGSAVGAAIGSISVPVPFIPIMGVQVDTLAGTWDSDPLYGGALHIFFRDPSIGLLGAYGEWTYVSPEHYGRVGAELEIYLGRFSFEGVAGGSFGQNVDDSFFDEVDLAYYVTDDFRVSAGHVYSQLGHQGKLGVEYQLPWSTGPIGVSAFGEGRIGENDYYGAWAGLKLYFGKEQKSLIRRHREDDPRTRYPSSIAPLTNCGIKTGAGKYCGSDDDFDKPAKPTPTPVIGGGGPGGGNSGET